MKLSDFAERYIFVRKCAGCGELIGYEGREDAFCPSCRISWERAKADGCVTCGRSMIECDCMPKKLSAAGLPFLKKLVAYRAEDAQKAENRPEKTNRAKNAERNPSSPGNLARKTGRQRKAAHSAVMYSPKPPTFMAGL